MHPEYDLSDKIYKRNCENLGLKNFPSKWEHHPLQVSKNGYPVLEYNGIWLHSKYDPIKEAVRLIDTVQPKSADQLVVFFGAGLGYSILEFCRKWPNRMYWIEWDARLQQDALSLFDFSICKDRLKIINPATMLDQKKAIIQHAFSDDLLNEIAGGLGNDDIIFISHRNSYRIFPEFEALQRSLEQFLNRKSVNMMTMGKFDKLWGHNLIRNFTELLKARPVSLLFDTLKGESVIVCAAGPSLQNDIEHIRALSTKCVIICVDTALRILESSHIEPDIVVCVDPQSVNQYYLEFIRSSKAIFVVDPATSALCLRHIPLDRLYFMHSPFELAKILNESFSYEIGKIAYGGSVSTNAYDLAVKLGCRHILLFGHDFAFTRSKAHSGGAILEERLNFQENRFFRRELHNYNQLFALPVRYLPGKHNRPIPTNDKLIIFLQWFEKRILLDLQNGVQVYDLKSDGAKLSGAKTNLDDWKPEAKNRIALSAMKAIGSDKDIFLESMQSACENVKRVHNLSTHALEISTQIHLLAKKNDNSSMNKLLKELDQIDRDLGKLKKWSNIVGSMMQKIVYSITNSGEITDSKHFQNNPGSSMDKSVELYTGLKDASSRLLVWMQKGQDLFQSNFKGIS